MRFVFGCAQGAAYGVWKYKLCRTEGEAFARMVSMVSKVASDVMVWSVAMLAEG